MQQAVSRWVDGAVLNPNAAQRPVMMNDQHYAAFFQYKTYTYTFHNTILRHIENEVKHGNVTPLLAAIALYPAIITAADLMKIMLVSGGDPPGWSRSISGVIAHASVRSNLGGSGQMIIDGLPIIGQGHPMSSFGPAADQFVTMTMAPFNSDMSVGNEMLRSLPAGNVWAKDFGESTPLPEKTPFVGALTAATDPFSYVAGVGLRRLK